jgi:hypothetical protein
MRQPSASGSDGPLDALLKQGARHEDALVRAWARKLLAHGDRLENRRKTPRRRKPAAK